MKAREPQDPLCDAVDLAVDTDPLKLRDALWAVLAIERTDRRFVRADDPETTQWMVGHDAALDDVRKAIASALGVRFYPTDKITPLPTNKASQP